MNTMSRSSEQQVQAFRFWIQGYQNFYEPMVAAYFESKGYRVERRAIAKKEELMALADALFDGRREAEPEVPVKKVIEFLRKRRRIQADMLVEEHGGAYLVECKSWGGFARFDRKLVEGTFITDPRNAAFLLLDRACGRELVGKILVLSSPSVLAEPIDDMLSRAFRTEVQTVSLETILRDPAIRPRVQAQLQYLDAAVAALRHALLPNEEEQN